MSTSNSNSKNLAYIVLPPGHGKSVLHNPSVMLFEADQLVNYKDIPTLVRLRKEARVCGDWSQFDFAWGLLLAKNCPDGGVVMVPHTAVGQAMSATKLGSIWLDMDNWRCNFDNRSGDPEKYLDCWDDARQGGTFSPDNQATTRAVYALLENWSFQKGV